MNQQLAELNKVSDPLTMVRYFYGTQSDSMVGYMVVFSTPTSRGQTIHFTHESGISVLFGVNDIQSIDVKTRIIRLKSPSDYASEKT